MRVHCKACGETALHRLWSKDLGLVRVCGQHMMQWEQADLDRQEELLVEWTRMKEASRDKQHLQGLW